MVVESEVEVDDVGDHEGASSRGFESGVVIEARSRSTPYIMVTVEGRQPWCNNYASRATSR